MPVRVCCMCCSYFYIFRENRKQHFSAVSTIFISCAAICFLYKCNRKPFKSKAERRYSRGMSEMARDRYLFGSLESSGNNREKLKEATKGGDPSAEKLTA